MENGHLNGKRTYWIGQCVPDNAYIIEALEGEKFPKALNGKYSK